jgi:LPXTG-motif cell wall-anchored protein
MKKMKKLFAMLIAMVMVLGMSMNAFADSEYTITVNGAIKEAKYEAYKVFDVTYDATDNNKVNYTIISGHDVSEIEGFSTVFKTVGDGTKYVERASAGITDTQIIDWLKDHETQIKTKCEKAAEVTNTTGSDSVTLDVGSAGYYFIASTLGDKSAVTIDTAHPTATVNSKITDGPSVDENAKKIVINNQEVDVADLEPGTVVDFKVEFNATNYAVKDEKQTVILNYVVEDAPNGFAIQENTVAVALDGNQTAPSITKKVGDDGKLTVTIPWGTKTGEGEAAVITPATYNNPTKVTITYRATLTAVTKATNKATIKYNDDQNVGDDETEIYNHIVNVNKYDADDKKITDGEDGKKDYSQAAGLPGAQFAVKNNDGKYYKLTETTTGEGDTAKTTYVVTWVNNLEDATTYWTSEEGTADGTTYQAVAFKGLEAGNYTLVEVTAPKGYSLAADTNFTLTAPTEKVDDETILSLAMNVEDKAGTTLPSTGGMGTTIFYALGAVLVIGAGVVLATRRRNAQ